jgi:hypothetical protein
MIIPGEILKQICSALIDLVCMRLSWYHGEHNQRPQAKQS